MAKLNVLEIADPTVSDFRAKSLAADRVELANEASVQIEALLDAIKHEAAFENDQFDVLLRALLPRLGVLNSVVMSVVGGDAGRTTEEMMVVVHG